MHDGRPVTVYESLHHKSLNFGGLKADEVLSHGWYVNYSSLPLPPILYEATCHKHHQPTAISDILNLSLSTFLITGQTHDWCTVHHSSSPWARITLDLNNSSNLFVIVITLTLRLELLLNWKTSSLRLLVSSPLTCRQLWLQLKVIASFFNMVVGSCRYWPTGVSSGRHHSESVRWLVS